MKKVILLTAIICLTASFAYAQAGYGGRGHGGGQGNEMGCRPDCDMKGMGQFGSQGKGHGNRGSREGMVLRLAEEIGLDDAQIDKIKESITDHKLTMVDARAEAKKAQIKVQSLMRDDDASDVEVMDAIDKASMAKAKIAKLRYTHRNEIHNILTDEQLDKLEELRKTRFEERNEKFGKNDDRPKYRGRRFGN